MSDVVIRAEGLGKKYIIGHQSTDRTTAFRDVIAQTARNLARTAVDMARGRPIYAGDQLEEFWALKEVGFEVRRGDVVGIIGRNGAGKSTLLKILSQITEPSEGRVEIKGRVASLLEVGTGFHQELSGRENIFLNGAILGMPQSEIRQKFDEIVEFAGVEKFLDTPVKRFSSGMYVRLAFSVAAHLDPEILVVDEVLAVGDAAFQRKCLGKMKDVAGHGRTVLFVSHNLASIEVLCRTGMLLRDGRLVTSGPIGDVVSAYSSQTEDRTQPVAVSSLPSTGRRGIWLSQVEFLNPGEERVTSPKTGAPIIIRLSLAGSEQVRGRGRMGITFSNAQGVQLFTCANETAHGESIVLHSEASVDCRIEAFPLTKGTYGLRFFVEVEGTIEHWTQEPYWIDVEDGSFFGTGKNVPAGHEGKYVLVPNSWSTPES